MFENNQLTLPLAYILVLVMCMVSLVLLSAVRWMERDFCGKPKLAFHCLFGFMLVMDMIWALSEYSGRQTRLVTFVANSFWCGCFVWICYRWHEDCLASQHASGLKRWVPRPLLLLPVFATWLFVASSWWTGLVVGVSKAGSYSRGPYLWVIYAVVFFYLVSTIPTCVFSAVRSRSPVLRGGAISCLMATGTLLLSAFLQYQTGFAFIFIGVIITMAIIDFGTQRKALEVERVKARQAALTAASHDIRTPLNAVIGFAELLKDEPSNGQRREMVEAIITSGRSLMRLVNNVAELPKLETVKSASLSSPADRPDPVGEARAAVVSEKKSAADNDGVSRKRRILVVDDVTLNRTVISALLKKLGHDDITQASDGDEALALLQAGPDRYDLVLTDLQMPKMDGDELVRKIREDSRLAKLQVHVVTADVQARTSCANVGFDSILIKPVTMAKLSKLLTGIWN